MICSHCGGDYPALIMNSKGEHLCWGCDFNQRLNPTDPYTITVPIPKDIDINRIRITFTEEE